MEEDTLTTHNPKCFECPMSVCEPSSPDCPLKQETGGKSLSAKYQWKKPANQAHPDPAARGVRPDKSEASDTVAQTMAQRKAKPKRPYGKMRNLDLIDWPWLLSHGRLIKAGVTIRLDDPRELARHGIQTKPRRDRNRWVAVIRDKKISEKFIEKLCPGWKSFKNDGPTVQTIPPVELDSAAEEPGNDAAKGEAATRREDGSASGGRGPLETKDGLGESWVPRTHEEETLLTPNVTKTVYERTRDGEYPHELLDRLELALAELLEKYPGRSAREYAFAARVMLDLS